LDTIKQDAKPSLSIEIYTMLLHILSSLSFLPHLIIKIKIRNCS
jgi:hypothetical protein